MISTKTKLLSFLMAVLFLFGMISPSIHMVFADDPTDESTETQTTDAVEGQQETVDDNENETDKIDVSMQTHIITSFDIKYDEETGEQMPLFNIVIDEDTQIESLNFPSIVSATLDDSDEQSDVAVLEWEKTEPLISATENDTYYAPKFDESVYSIKQGIDIPYGIVSIAVKPEAETVKSDTITEANEKEDVLENKTEGKKIITGFYFYEENEEYVSPIKGVNIAFYLKLPANAQIDTFDLPKNIDAFVDEKTSPESVKIIKWEIAKETFKDTPSNSIVLKAVFPEEYIVGEKCGELFGILIKEKNLLKANRAGDSRVYRGESEDYVSDLFKWKHDWTYTGTSSFKVKTPFHAGEYLKVNKHYFKDSSGNRINDIYAYCLEQRWPGPKTTSNTESNYGVIASVKTLDDVYGSTNANKIRAILDNGYPMTTTINGVTWSAEYARQITQNALRCFLANIGQEAAYPAFSSSNISYYIEDTANGTAMAAVAYLVNKANNQERFNPTLSLSQTSVTLTKSGTNYVGQVSLTTNMPLSWITIASNSISSIGGSVTISNGTLTITIPESRVREVSSVSTTFSYKTPKQIVDTNAYFYEPSRRKPKSTRQALLGLKVVEMTASTSLSVNVRLPEGTLAIKKVSANTSATNGNSYYSLSGAVYTVYTGANKTGTNKGSITTDANGNGTTSLTLTPGTYYLHETTAPSGYQLNDTDYQFTIAGGQTLVLSGASGTNTTDNKYNVEILKDNPKGYIKLTKTSSNTGVTNNNSNYSLSGAVYGIYTDSACTTEALAANGTSSRMTTNASGYVESKWLNYGTYYVKEITASTGYTLDTNTYTVTVNATTPIITVTSKETPITGSVTIVKISGNTTVTNGNSNYSLAGGVYEIKQGDTVKGTLTTNADGTSNTVSGLPLGSYTLTEKTAPPGFIRNTTSYTFTITGSALKTITSSDTAILSDSPVLATINITKVSNNTNITSGNSNYSLAGAVYKIVGNGKTYTFPATDANGNAQLTNIPLGSYTLSEVTPPTGYMANTATYTLTITSNSTTYNITGANVSALSDAPITGTVNITKSSSNTAITDGNSDYSLAGAVYKLVGNGKTYTFPATDANGKASLTGLPLGSYTLSEVTPPKGYKANSNTYTVTISNATAVNISASNTDALKDEPILGQFKIKKASAVPSITNGNSCYSLAGAEYKLYKADGTFVATLTTNANGEATKAGLTLGSYYLVETKASQGYAVSPGRKEFTLTSASLETFTGGIFNETPLNDPIAALVYKVDADTGERVPQGGASLAGAQFTVKYYDALYDTVPASATPKYTWIFQTDEDGFVAFLEMYKVSGPALPVNSDGAPCVPIGTITIQETLPPVGYLINDTVHTYKIDSENGMLVARYPSIEINETVKKGRFTIEKYTMDTKSGSIDAAAAQASAELEQGAIFQVIDKDGEVVDTLTTGANGRATTIDLPYGTYKIHQISGATGYFFIDDTTVSITENGENKLYKLYNDRKNAAIHVVKKDAETGAVIKVSGVTFEIYDSANNKLTIGGQSSFTTNANGEFTTAKQLPYGSYTLKETVAPEGYALPTTSISFTINDSNYGSGLIEVVAFDAKASCEINLYKTGLICTGFETVTENGYQVTRPKFEEGFLTGVVFSLYAKTDILNNNGTVKYHAGELVMDNVTTEADGHAHFRGLQSGTYEVRETSTLNGYLLLSEPIEVTCDLGDAQEIVVEPVGPIYNELKSVEIKFLKQKQIFSVSNGSGSYSYVAASGFTFGLYSGETLTLIGSGTTYTLPANTLIATAVSDSNGQVNFAGYYPAGNYYVKELEVQNDAYMLDDATYPISITMTNTAPQTVVIDNTSTPIHNDLYKANIKVVKKDAETGNVIPLAGATFEIRNSNDILVDTVVTDATGHAETSIALPYGTYSIKETVPPEGYVLDSTPNNILIDSTTVETDEAVEYVEYVANDTRIKGKITVVKKGLALTAANVEAENGFQVTKLAYTEEFLPNVKIDLYAVEDIVFLGEIKYAAGTKVTSGTTTSDGRLEFDELYLGSYELRETESASDVYVLPSQNEQVTLTSTNNTIDVVERTVNMNNVVRDVEISFVKKVPSVSTTTNGENVTTTISTNHSDFIAATEGFVFGLYNSTAIEMYNNNGTIPANTLLATATIGQNGVVSFNQKLPHGTYYIKEIAFPEKYAALTGNIDGFTIIPDDLTQDSIEISLGDVYNELITVDMSIYKYDEDTEAPLGTALFEIKDNDTGVVLFRGRTNDSGMLGPVAIYPGSFTLTELEAPEDYDIAEPITFTVTPEGKVMVGETEIQNGQFNIPDEYINIPNVVLPRTGSKAALWLTIGGGIAVAAGIAVFIIVGKKKKDDDEE